MTKLSIHYGKSETNKHGAAFVTLRGPKITRVRLSVHKPSTGYRFIFYFPSGAWWHLDFTFDRRNLPTRWISFWKSA